MILMEIVSSTIQIPVLQPTSKPQTSTKNTGKNTLSASRKLSRRVGMNRGTQNDILVAYAFCLCSWRGSGVWRSATLTMDLFSRRRRRAFSASRPNVP